jgi:hypothetical protein
MRETASPRPLPVGAYRWLHLGFVATFTILLATGLLIQLPDWRARLVGGYSWWVAGVHEWAGAAMALLPLVALARTPRQAIATFARRARRRNQLRLHAAHLVFTSVAAAVFTVTGFVLWFQDHVPAVVADVSVELHVLFTYALLVAIPLHVAVSGRSAWRNTVAYLSRTRATTRGVAGLVAPSPLAQSGTEALRR